VLFIRYDGNPLKARRGQYLSFDKDEKLEILDQSDSEWWEVSTSSVILYLYKYEFHGCSAFHIFFILKKIAIIRSASIYHEPH